MRRTAPVRTGSGAVQRVPTIDDVRLRAYEIYLNRGSFGDALSDWLQAEQELRGGDATADRQVR